MKAEIGGLVSVLCIECICPDKALTRIQFLMSHCLYPIARRNET
jgi:hypothetical protein